METKIYYKKNIIIRKKKLIDLWGYEEWEKMYTYPNYDYYYFDKLDELCNDEYDEYDENYIYYKNEEEYE